jgi:hypothetical protein
MISLRSEMRGGWDVFDISHEQNGGDPALDAEAA